MAMVFLLLALIGGALVGDLIWENTSAGEVTVLDRTATTYPQGWLLAAAAATGFMIALLLVASVSSTKARRNRRREFRSVKRDLRDQAFEPEHASWLDEPVAREEPAGDTGVLPAPLRTVVRAYKAGPPARRPWPRFRRLAKATWLVTRLTG